MVVGLLAVVPLSMVVPRVAQSAATPASLPMSEEEVSHVYYESGRSARAAAQPRPDPIDHRPRLARTAWFPVRAASLSVIPARGLEGPHLRC